jgi:hypothetical protein
MASATSMMSAGMTWPKRSKSTSLAGAGVNGGMEKGFLSPP